VYRVLEVFSLNTTLIFTLIIISTTPMTNGCHNDDMIQLSTLFSVAVSVRPDHGCVFLHLLLL